MSAPNEGTYGPPLAFCFIGQSGRRIDASTHGAIRSHAMKEFRNRQRQQRQQDQSVNAQKPSICRCLDLAQPLSKAAQQDSEMELSTPSTLAHSERCDRCGMIQSSTQPSSQTLVAWKASTLPITILSGVGLFDFSSMAELLPSMPLKFTDEINAIKTHVVALSPTTMKSDILPVAFQMPGLLASILYMTYSHLSSARGWGNGELALLLKAAAISHINRKMSHPSTATCTNVIAAISYLCTGLWIFGNSEEMEIHLNGLDLMVKQRGMDSLGVYQFGTSVRRYLFLQHHLLAVVRAQPITSTFNFDYARLSKRNAKPSAKYTSPLYCPGNSFTQLLRSRGLSRGTVRILRQAKALIDSVIDLDEGRIAATEFETLLCDAQLELESHESSHSLRSKSSNDSIFECCRLTVLIMLDAAENAQSLTSGDQDLTLALVRALENADVEGSWARQYGLLYWVAMVGSAAAQGKPGHGLLDSMLSRMMSEIAFMVVDFSFAVEPIRQFSRLQMALSRRSQLQLLESTKI